MEVVDRTERADRPDPAGDRVAVPPAVGDDLAAWLADHPSLDPTAGRIAWVDGRAVDAGPARRTTDLDLTGPDDGHAVGYDLLHVVGLPPVGPGPERGRRLAVRWRAVEPGRFLALSFPALEPDGDLDRLRRDLLDGTAGRVVLEYLQVHEAGPDNDRGWTTMVVRRLR